MRPVLGRFLIVATLLIARSLPAVAQPSAIWFAPPGNASHDGGSFRQLAQSAEAWREATANISVFSMDANELLLDPPANIVPQLDFLVAHGKQLNVTVLALPVDKHICGNGVEGTVWPGEPAAYAQKFKTLGAKINFFSFDGPFISGHLYAGKNACRLTVMQTARHVAITVQALRRQYPTARFVDLESPNYASISKWKQNLNEWLTDFRAATGEDLYALTMDINWGRPWADAVQETAKILRTHGTKVGVFLNAAGGRGISANDWINAAKQHMCDLEALHLNLDYVVITNWSSTSVPSLPESSSDSLTSLVNWYASKPSCGS